MLERGCAIAQSRTMLTLVLTRWTREISVLAHGFDRVDRGGPSSGKERGQHHDEERRDDPLMNRCETCRASGYSSGTFIVGMGTTPEHPPPRPGSAAPTAARDTDHHAVHIGLPGASIGGEGSRQSRQQLAKAAAGESPRGVRGVRLAQSRFDTHQCALHRAACLYVVSAGVGPEA